MSKLLADTRIVAAIAALVVVCLTVLAALGKVPGMDVVKILGAFLSGVVLAWKRGTELSEEEAAAVKIAEALKRAEGGNKIAIPPVLPLLGICLAFLFLPGATCAQAKPIIRTVNDIAADWCVAHYSSMKGLSAEDALKAFCTGEKVLKPWLDLILMGQKQGVGKMGVSGDKCEVTVVKEAATDAAAPVTDAGRD